MNLDWRMRLWSIHPCYLDSAGLTALWREALLAKRVLEGKTKGYRNHPQLMRFRDSEDAFGAINAYLHEVWREADSRGYKFDGSKYELIEADRIPVTAGQVEYEFEHLRRKLKRRNAEKFEEIERVKKKDIKAHPLFVIVRGGVECWERVKRISNIE